MKNPEPSLTVKPRGPDVSATTSHIGWHRLSNNSVHKTLFSNSPSSHQRAAGWGAWGSTGAVMAGQGAYSLPSLAAAAATAAMGNTAFPNKRCGYLKTQK
jgi:hypothetical protein